MKPSGVGGMAVMEGVMMKNKEEYAVAVRKPNNEIVIDKRIHKDFSDKVKLFKLPIFRGILAFVDSMVVGVKVLNYSASFFEEEEDTSKTKKGKSKSKSESVETDFEIEEVTLTSSEADRKQEEEITLSTDKAKKEESTTLLMVFAVMISIALSVGLFMVLPVLLIQIVSKVVSSNIVLNLIEGIIRLAIFIGYVLLASLMTEIKRTFMYHGAEHKTINCLENGYELTVENVRKQSKQHKRCGTSFMLLVILISLVFFMFIPTGNLVVKILSRVLIVPFIAGISYEFIRLAGKSESKVVDFISKPGLWMQGLTTKEPDDSMIEVAIASVGAVFDWRLFLDDNKKDKKSSSKKNSNSKQSSASKQSNSTKQSSNEKNTPVKKESASKKAETVKPEVVLKKDNITDKVKQENQIKGNTSNKEKITQIKSKPAREDEEDDEILKALDKFFDNKAQ